MPRPARIIRPREKRINLPEDLCAQVDIMLYSELEGKVPFAAWSKLVEGLLRAHLDSICESEERHAELQAG